VAEPARLRLFVALELPAAAREALAVFCDEAADPKIWRPVRDEALHVTLAFLGHRPAEDAATVSSVLSRCAGPAPPLAFGGALLLPPRRARVLCAEVADVEGELGALQARVAAGLVHAGVYEPSHRPFRPHATVARLRSGARSPRSAPVVDPSPLAFLGETLTLYRSGGAVYEPLARVPLPRASTSSG